jgi:hypothetical protein
MFLKLDVFFFSFCNHILMGHLCPRKIFVQDVKASSLNPVRGRNVNNTETKKRVPIPPPLNSQCRRRLAGSRSLRPLEEMAAAGSESEMQADLAAQRAACERQVAAGRDPSAWAAFRAGLHSARSGAHQTFSRKGTPPPPSLSPSLISTGTENTRPLFNRRRRMWGDFRSPNEILQICGFPL